MVIAGRKKGYREKRFPHPAGHPAASLRAALMGFALLSAGPAQAVEFKQPLAVVELFTSQGCSSCPPADKALGEFNRRDEVLGLALHVDYWDRLGWKDTFASPENTQRQWRYATALGERQVYTPQAIVNGRAHFVGSRKGEIAAAAERFSREGKGLTVPVEATLEGNAIHVRVPFKPEAADATLYMVYYDGEREVEIRRGENAGRTLRYTNIVGKMETIGMVDAAGIDLKLAIDDIRQKGYSDCALILQSKHKGAPGPILGATVISDL
ncbi:MAG: DUF1223 domain-containing protein [Nitratireductor sp.]|nr:DUF1223 domain-containing protein [Nitratireductor sp.]